MGAQGAAAEFFLVYLATWRPDHGNTTLQHGGRIMATLPCNMEAGSWQHYLATWGPDHGNTPIPLWGRLSLNLGPAFVLISFPFPPHRLYTNYKAACARPPPKTKLLSLRRYL